MSASPRAVDAQGDDREESADCRSAGPFPGAREKPAEPRHPHRHAAAAVSDASRQAAHRREEPYVEWSSERAFVLSTAAAGVGLGNLWRFPTLVGENGGGAFLLAYAVAVLVAAIPFGALEISIGRAVHGSTVSSFRALGRGLVLLGLAAVLMTFLIDSYYFVVTGWTLGYAVEATLGAAPGFDAFTRGYASLWWLIAVGAGVFVVLAAGLSAIERFASWLTPVLVLLLLALAGVALTQGAAAKALDFLFSPELDRLGDGALWRAAAGQAFYSLTIGQGYLITYGSYVPRRVNVGRSIASIAAINSSVAILGGLAIFPIVFAAGQDPAAGSELAFTVLPDALSRLAGGPILQALFFWLFFFAAFSSCIGGTKVVTAALREQIPKLGGAGAVVAGVGAIVAAGVPSALSYSALDWRAAGRPVLDWLDRTVGGTGVIVAALATALVISWTRPVRQIGAPFGLTGRPAEAAGWIVRLVPIVLAPLFLL